MWHISKTNHIPWNWFSKSFPARYKKWQDGILGSLYIPKNSQSRNIDHRSNHIITACVDFFCDHSTLGIAKMFDIVRRVWMWTCCECFFLVFLGKHVLLYSFTPSYLKPAFYLDFPGGRRFSTISWGRLGSETSCRLPDAPSNPGVDSKMILRWLK